MMLASSTKSTRERRRSPKNQRRKRSRKRQELGNPNKEKRET
jgi:hypothetical protein